MTNRPSTAIEREPRRCTRCVRATPWIRTSCEFDAIIDFEHAVADPTNPDRILPTYDSGDHLHPCDAGYRAMAAAVDLRVLLRDLHLGAAAA